MSEWLVKVKVKDECLLSFLFTKTRSNVIIAIFIFCIFSLLSFFRHLTSEVTERISTKLRYRFTYDCYLKIWFELHLAFTPTGWGKRFFGTDFEFWPNVSLQRNMISTIGKNLSIYRDSPIYPKFGKLLSRNGWERLVSFCPPLNFRFGRHCQPYAWMLYIIDSRQTSVSVMQWHELTV